MSLVRVCMAVSIAGAFGFAQAQVGLSGTVTSNKSGAALEGAVVKLLALGLSDTTDAQGRFSLTGPSGVLRPGGREAMDGWAGPRSLQFRQDIEGWADIRVYDLSGTVRATLFSGVLPGGEWSVALPNLPSGLYVCAFDGPGTHKRVRFLSTPAGGVAASSATMKFKGAAPGSVAPRSAAAPLDTLVVTKSGYIQARLPLSSLQQTGMAVKLDDSGAVSDVDDATIVPDASWTAYMADGIPPPSLGTKVFSIVLQIGAIRDVGLTKFGQRRQYDIKGGTVTGDKITATVVEGGLDYDLTLSNGSKEIEQIIILKAGTTPILMRNPGVAPIGAKNARMVLDFEAPNSSSYTWLNTGKFAAMRIVDTVAKTIKMDVYDISKVTLPTKKVQIKDPSGVTNQTWECLSFKGTQGATLFTENVTLGSSISIGASKRGSRNIIPITGGTTTGKIVGKVLSGGADYQLGGLDARYTLAPNDGELIIIRNCGANGLVPVFEARIGSVYEYLNENKFMSSSPNVGGGGVSLTFYEMK